jgi:hypothetical protein
MMFYRAGPIKRRRRTRAQVEQLEQQIYDVLGADHPQSVRHVFYRMTDPRLPEPVDKTERGYDQIVNRLTIMRRNGVIPYGWITDATRRGYHVATYDGAGDFIRSVAGLYRANIWNNSDNYVEVWTESRSIAGVIQNDCEELAVSLYPAGGFSSLTLCYEAAGFIEAETDYGEKAAHVLYIGDYDPAGVLIDQQIERELLQHLDVDLTFHRLAVNPDQITALGLPTKPRKATDRRARHIREAVEAESIPAGHLRKLLRRKIESFMPTRALEVAKVAEESERLTLLDLAEQIGEA